MSYFNAIKLRGWRQFEDVELDLSKRVTIITGTNGCGKTTILTLLSRHFGWDIRFASTPYVSKRAAKRLFRDVHARSELKKGGSATESSTTETDHDDERNVEIDIGQITYDTGQICNIRIPTFVTANYQVKLDGQVSKDGLFIPSHRQQSVYYRVSQIPADPVSAAQIYDQYRSIFSQFYQSGARQQKNPGQVQKEALIALAAFGEGNSSLMGNPEYVEVFNSFEERIKKILPKEIGLTSISVNMPEVILKTESGDFSLDAMSGGVSSLFNIAWQIICLMSHGRPIPSSLTNLKTTCIRACNGPSYLRSQKRFQRQDSLFQPTVHLLCPAFANPTYTCFILTSETKLYRESWKMLTSPVRPILYCGKFLVLTAQFRNG